MIAFFPHSNQKNYFVKKATPSKAQELKKIDDSLELFYKDTIE